MKIIEAEYIRAKTTPSDISEHIPRLYELASKCDSVVEGGVRYVVSSWAFLYGCACRGGNMVSYCWNRLPEIDRALRLCDEAGVKWTYHDGDWLLQEIPETDLLFIDTNHFYWQLREELTKHGPKARRYIICHDTESFGEVGADGKRPGLWRAIEEFVDANPQWRVQERLRNCNGLTILSKKPT